MEPCPPERTKRSRPGHFGLLGLWRRCRVHTANAMAAAPMGSPGWPELACCTASAARKRIVLIARVSRSFVMCNLLIGDNPFYHWDKGDIITTTACLNKKLTFMSICRLKYK